MYCWHGMVQGHSYEKFLTQKFVMWKFHNVNIFKSTDTSGGVSSPIVLHMYVYDCGMFLSLFPGSHWPFLLDLLWLICSPSLPPLLLIIQAQQECQRTWKGKTHWYSVMLPLLRGRLKFIGWFCESNSSGPLCVCVCVRMRMRVYMCILSNPNPLMSTQTMPFEFCFGRTL